MDNVLTHVAGLDVHQATVVATVRLPGPDRDARDDDAGSAGLARVAAGVCRHARRAGEYQRVLKAGVLRPGGRVHAVVDQHAPVAACAGPQDGRAGQRVAGAVAGVRAAARQSGPAAHDPGTARHHAVSGAATAGSQSGGEPALQGAGRRGPETVERGQRCPGGQRPRDDHGADPGDDRPGGAGGPRARAPAAEAAGVAGSAARAVPPGACVSARADSGED